MFQESYFIYFLNSLIFILKAILRGGYNRSHFIDEKTEAQRC